VSHYSIIGAAVGSSAGISGCEAAPELIRSRLPYLAPLWKKTINYRTALAQDPVNNLEIFSRHLATLTREVLSTGDTFITFGGDHSCAIGTWSGVAQVHDEFGLIWIDAHMDAHTPETSPSGNFHGMPVACLLGHGDPRLTSIGRPGAKLKPENFVQIGIRSYESGEAALLQKLGVRVYMMEEVTRKGFAACMQEIIAGFTQRKLPYGISLDLDGLDPRDFAALGTPVRNGISLAALFEALDLVDYENLIGMEFAEYNPRLDNKNFSGVAAIDLILRHLHGLIPLPLAAAN
jgi:arginase